MFVWLFYCFFVHVLRVCIVFFFFSSRRRHTRYWRDWSSDVCSSDLGIGVRRRIRGRDMLDTGRSDREPRLPRPNDRLKWTALSRDVRPSLWPRDCCVGLGGYAV